MYDKASKDNQARTRAAAYREAAALYTVFAETVRQFDGKVFNCKLQNALHAAGCRIFTERRYKWLEFYCYPKGLSYSVLLAQIPLEEMPDGKRIPANAIIASAREYREKLLKQAATLEEYIDQVDLVEKQLEHFRSQIDKIRNSLPYEVRDIYRLNYYVNP